MKVVGSRVRCPNCSLEWPVPRNLGRVWRCANCRTVLFRSRFW